LRDEDKNPVPGLTVSLTPQGPASATPAAVEILNSTSGCTGSQAPAGTTDCNGQVSFHVTDDAVENIRTWLLFGDGLRAHVGTTTGPISVSGTVGPATIDFVAVPPTPAPRASWPARHRPWRTDGGSDDHRHAEGRLRHPAPAVP